MDNPNRSPNSTAQEQRPHHQEGVEAPSTASLRSEGRSWAEVCRDVNISKGSAQRAFMSVSASACAAD